MKLLRDSLLALMGLTLAASAYAGPPPPTIPIDVPSDDPGFYVSVAGGALWLDDVDIQGVNLDFDTGFAVFAAVGYTWAYGLSLELEAGYALVDSADFDFHGIHGSLEGDFEQVPIMFNALYSIPVNDSISIYIGAGTGIVWSDASVDSINGIGLGGFGETDDEWNWAAQGKAGISFQVCPEATLNIGYRLLYGNEAFAGADDAVSHIVEGGFTWRF